MNERSACVAHSPLDALIVNTFTIVGNPETTCCWSIVAKSPLQCAGINRHEAEEEEASRERTSDPLGPEFCVGHREVHGEA